MPEEGKGTSPMEDHPCGGGLHLPGTTRAVPATEQPAPSIAFIAASSRLETFDIIPTILTADGIEFPETFVLPAADTPSIPLRI